MTRRIFCAALLAGVLSGCAAPAPQPDVAALRTSLTAASITELEQVLTAAMNGASVTLSDDALTTSSTLTLEQGARRSIDGGRVLGRDYGRPAHFRLVLDGRQCFLVHRETGLRWMLRDTTCEAE